MSYASSLPRPGSSISLRVSYVDARPDVILVRLWGAPPHKLLAYKRLRNDIQAFATSSAHIRFCTPSPGDCCLVHVDAQWQRGRVISRQGNEFRILLLDEGRNVLTRTEGLLPGRPEFFQLPSEVVACVLANLIPPPNSRELTYWSPRALEVFGSLLGCDVQGVVREVFALQRLLVLDALALTAHMQEQGLAQRIPDSTFRAILHRCLSPLTSSHPPHTTATAAPPPPPSPLPATKTGRTEHRRALPAMTGQLDYFYPQLQPGVTEPVTVTHVADPHRVFCQLRSLSQEIQRLSDSMCHIYEARRSEGRERPEALGQPCAARASDGRWHRALLQELLPEQRLALVLLVDYGRKELVACDTLRPLQSEYFRMPVVTYCCALFGIADWGGGWSPAQVSELRSLTLGKTLNAKIEYYSTYEHVYFVTLWQENDRNVNCLFGLQAHCLTGGVVAAQKNEGRGEPYPPAPASALPLDGVPLALHSFHDAVVEFVTDPSEFWVRTKEYAAPYRSMMEAIAAFYSRSPKLEGIVMKPKPGLLCCAKFKDNCFYRATVVAVHDKLVDVYFVDSGNTETVDWYDVKELLPQFKELPAMAVKCCLVDVSPLRDCWSVETIDYFKKIVVDKELVIYVLSKQDDKYAIEVLDESRTGEKNVSKILSQVGHAKYQEFEVAAADKTVSLLASAHTTKEVNYVNSQEQQLGGDQRMKKDKLLKLLRRYDLNGSSNDLQSNSSIERKDANGHVEVCSDLIHSSLDLNEVVEYVGYNFEVGSTETVQVSYVETPALFWCQLVRSANELKWLMQKIQDYCKNVVCPYKYNRLACLAKYSEDGQWYRALITSGMPSVGASSIEQVEVRYVDYGNKETVSVKDLCLIHKDFLHLNAQAFRCSLYNLIEPTGNDPFVWDESAILAFQDFVDGASANHVDLSCTVFAITAVNNIQINVVDLLTPFESICHVLTEKRLAQYVQLEKPLVAFLQLSSYYYSMHDIKIGSEEDVYVTHVDDPSTFYCQLARNSDTLEQLTHEIAELCAAPQCLKYSNTNMLCLAKYTDQQWYRGIIKCAKLNKEIFFVDFGNTQKVKDEDLLRIPKDAYKILRLPMQAIKCGLSDIPVNIPEEVIKWFEKAVTDRSLKAIVVAKESDGKLVLELYDRNIQINAKMKESMGLRCHRESSKTILDTCAISRNIKVNDEKRTVTCVNKDVESKIHFHDKGEVCDAKIGVLDKVKVYQNSEGKNLPKYQGFVEEVGGGGGDKVLNFGSKKVESTLCSSVQKDFKGVGFNQKAVHNENNHLSLKKFADLSKKIILPGFKTKVYVAHVNNLLDFFVQLVEDETQLTTISEGLKETVSESLQVKDVQPGDLVCALFPEDNLWYRAVVKEKQAQGLYVEYIDYGNSALIDICKICRLSQDLLSLPAISIHCSLSGLQTLSIPQEAILTFSERTSDIQIDCEFVQQLEHKWEVVLSDQQGLITEELHVFLGLKLDSQINEMPDLINQVATEEMQGETDSEIVKKDDVLTDSKQFKWMIPLKDQTVSSYVTAVDGPEHFWCQFAESNDLDDLTQKMQETRTPETTNVESVLNIHVGDACMVRYSEDEQWYRALVEKTEGDTATVRFVDYGNEEDTSKDVMRLIPDELLMIKVQAFPCCLFGFNSSEGSWAPDGNKMFYEMSTEDMVQVTVIDTESYREAWRIPLSLVILQCKGRNINNEMKQFWQFHLNDKSIVDSQSTVTKNIYFAESMAPDSCEPSTEITDLTQNLKNSMEQTASLCTDTDQLALNQCFDIVPYKSPFQAVETAVSENLSVIQFDKKELEDKETYAQNNEKEVEKADKEKWFGESDVQLLASDAQPLSTENSIALLACEVVAGTRAVRFEPCEDELRMQQVTCSEEMQAEQDMYEEVFKNPNTETNNELFSNLLVLDEEIDEETDIAALPYAETDKTGTTFTLAGFTVGCKCVIRSPEENAWAVAEILSISEEGTRVLILSNGKEVTVDPVNVWNTLPESAEIPAQAESQSCSYAQSSTENLEVAESKSASSGIKEDCTCLSSVEVTSNKETLHSSSDSEQESGSSITSKGSITLEMSHQNTDELSGNENANSSVEELDTEPIFYETLNTSLDHLMSLCSSEEQYGGLVFSSDVSLDQVDLCNLNSKASSTEAEPGFCNSTAMNLYQMTWCSSEEQPEEAASIDSSNASLDHEVDFYSLGKEDSSTESYNEQESEDTASSDVGMDQPISCSNEDRISEEHERGPKKSEVIIDYQMPSVNLVEVLVQEISHSHEIFEQELKSCDNPEMGVDHEVVVCDNMAISKDTATISEQEMRSGHSSETNLDLLVPSCISENTLGKSSSSQIENELNCHKEMQTEHEGEPAFVEQRTF